MANQKIEQQENGGLDDLSLQNYTDKITEFEDRARLSVKFQNATHFFTGKRYLLEQDYALIMTSDSIPVPALRLRSPHTNRFATPYLNQQSVSGGSWHP